METLTYVLLFAALLLIAVGAIGAIVYYDRRKQRQAGEKSDGT